MFGGPRTFLYFGYFLTILAFSEQTIDRACGNNSHRNITFQASTYIHRAVLGFCFSWDVHVVKDRSFCNLYGHFNEAKLSNLHGNDVLWKCSPNLSCFEQPNFRVLLVLFASVPSIRLFNSCSDT